MLLYQCYIFIVLCGISISFELPHDKSSMDIEIKPSATLSSNPGSGLSRNIGPKRARPNYAQAKGDNEGFKREIQVMNNVRMPSSFIKENGDIIKRMKRKAHYMPAQPKPQQSAQKAPKKEAKQEEVSPVPLIIGISITAFIVMFIFVCILLRFNAPDNEDEAAFENETREMRSFQRRRGRY